ncbi:MAG TPA: glycosyltransferase family protein [Bacteroidia bacterium]|nr:glycosyltransferase family protein [Bacteroidia bacterium]
MVKKFIFAVQGEGRGHMTQAISLYEMLVEQGHEVCAVILGVSSRREIPDFFLEKIKAPVIRLESPNFVTDRFNKSINIPATVYRNVLRWGRYKKSLKQIDALVREHQPDVIINFFDLLMGLYYRFKKPSPKLVCIAHQYIYFHPDFEFPEGHWFDRHAIRFYTRLTTAGGSKNLALSFYKIYTHHDEVVVVPPLLRKEVFELKAGNEEFFLVYLVNNGYFEEVLEWHRNNPQIQIHCFTDQAEALTQSYNLKDPKLQVHALNDVLFLEMMSKAKGLASTAGFESVCEAMYLGKPVMMVPVQGHFEQLCNSRDAYKVGAGIFADKFDLGKLNQFISVFDNNKTWYRNWVLNARQRIYKEVTSA